MGSLNGDVMVMRNGRSTSQVSVYNYPEHLNPFYEDDQHKRLRFWKINKKDSEGRRNSFSIGNLKEMWAFKSFRMKKKSSTLGINKTSESPPLLRRDYALDNSWNTFDHRLRASNTSSINSDSFQRNATYRSSLQTLPTNSERMGLHRNDGYRSTIQVTRSNPRYQPQQKQQTMEVSQNRRYVYGGSVTPQPSRSSGRTNIGKDPYEYECENALIRRSSQSSMTSTNPFESDDENSADISSNGMRSVVNGSTTTLTSRTPRKKRRAPAPPTPIRSNGAPALPIIFIEPSHDNTQDELHIEEDIEIANLTAEIESFVKTKSNDEVEVTQKGESQRVTETPATQQLLISKENVTNEKEEMESEAPEIIGVGKISAPTVVASDDIDTSAKEKTNGTTKANGQVTTAIATIATTANANEPVAKEINVTQIAYEIKTNTVESKETETNGAIPKKHQSNDCVPDSTVEEQLQRQATATAAELYIRETRAEELPQKPVPLKRQTKSETEVGHVECIHVHVESPKATPRKDRQNGLSSFKTVDRAETTAKTPFVLTSPPSERRNIGHTENAETAIKETVKILRPTTVSQRVNELNINEERMSAKPAVSVKPALSPKPVTKGSNETIHGFAEIHKPMRRNNQNGHVAKAFREESITSPIVAPLVIAETEKKINNTAASSASRSQECKLATSKQTTQFGSEGSLKIVESTTLENYEKQNGGSKAMADTKNMIKEMNHTNSQTIEKRNEMHKQDNEFDLLYRPKPTSYLEWKQSTLAPLETHIPPEKRKSVKDIIESINRSQRLLNAAANKDFTVLQNQSAAVKEPASSCSDNLKENLNILDEGQNKFNRIHEQTPLYADTEDVLAAANHSPSPSPSNCNNEAPQIFDSNEIFQKCKLKKEVYDYRETSPITSNLDWNPVPKPKRTKPGQD